MKSSKSFIILAYDQEHTLVELAREPISGSVGEIDCTDYKRETHPLNSGVMPPLRSLSEFFFNNCIKVRNFYKVGSSNNKKSHSLTKNDFISNSFHPSIDSDDVYREGVLHHPLNSYAK